MTMKLIKLEIVWTGIVFFKGLIIFIIILFFGCANISEYHKEFAESQYQPVIDNERELIEGFLENRWAAYRGALKPYFIHYKLLIPDKAKVAHDGLNAIYDSKPENGDWTEEQKFEAWTYRSWLIAEAMSAIWEEISPSLIKLISKL